MGWGGGGGGGGEPWSSTITDFQGMQQTSFKGGLNKSLHTELDPVGWLSI